MFHCHVNDHITDGMTARYEVKAKVAIDLIRSVAVETAAGSMRDLRVAEVTKMSVALSFKYEACSDFSSLRGSLAPQLEPVSEICTGR